MTTIRLTASVLLAQHIANLGLQKLFKAGEVTWSTCDILPDKEESLYRIITIDGVAHGMFTEHLYQTNVVVLLQRSDFGGWVSRSVTIRLSDNGDRRRTLALPEGMPTMVVYQCNDLESGIPCRVTSFFDSE